MKELKKVEVSSLDPQNHNEKILLDHLNNRELIDLIFKSLCKDTELKQ